MVTTIVGKQYIHLCVHDRAILQRRSARPSQEAVGNEWTYSSYWLYIQILFYLCGNRALDEMLS